MYEGHWCLKTLKRSDEEQIIHQDELLFTSNEPEEPVSTWKIASARVIDVQQHVTFVLFSNRNLFAKLFPPYCSLCIRTSWHRTKSKCKLRAMCETLSVPF